LTTGRRLNSFTVRLGTRQFNPALHVNWFITATVRPLDRPSLAASSQQTLTLLRGQLNLKYPYFIHRDASKFIQHEHYRSSYQQ